MTSPQESIDPSTVLRKYLPRDLTHSVLARQPLVTVVLDIAGRGRWTVRIENGEVSLIVGAIKHPTCSIRTSAATLADLLLGRRSGVEAFLAGDLVARGSLATVLQIGGAFAPEADLPTRAHSREVSALGVRTAYLEAGPADGRPVVLLHGLGATNASMLPVLADLAKDHRVISPDTPGFGASEAPRWTYTAEQMYRWLRSFLDVVDARGAVVIGNSMGGRLALELALRDPDAVDRLVLLCAAPAFRRFRQLTPLASLLPVSLGARLPFGPPRAALIAGVKSLFADPSRLPDSWYQAAIDEFVIAMKDSAHRRAAFSATLNIYTDEAFGETGFWDRLPQLAVPALFLWGAADHMVPPKFARYVNEALPQAESVVIPDCGHVPQFEHPELTMRLTRSFLATGRAHVPADRVLRQWKKES